VFRPHCRPWRPGEMVCFPALAQTLERLAADGFEAFYEGDLAKRQASMLAGAGAPFDPSDFHAHRSTWTEPIATDYRGTRVTTHPPNSAGIVALEILNILEAHDAPWPGSFGPSGPTDVEWIHRGIEASKLAMADRDLHVTDPEARDVPVAKLLNKDRAHGLADLIDPEHAALPPAALNPPGGGTIYLAVVDGEGNAVSLIESNWSGFGSGLADPETGIHYQNRGAFFSLDEDHPNVLAPGKRTLHTLVPGMLFRADEPWVVTGSMGGDAQPQIHAQIVSALVDGGVDLRTAIGAPRWFVGPRELLTPPVDVYAEPRFAPGVLEGLGEHGHPVVRTGPFDARLGHAHAIELVDGGPAAGGSVAAVTDPRSEGLPAAW
ncbi:MAG: gamma-glutamyltransferase, partial [Chloroflexi bacterium]|nr:gamma-glutamyltransferase [Chloroflexota bacterium]